MVKWINVGAWLSVAALGSAANAQSSSVCLTHDEARGLFAYAIPQAIEGVATACKASLPRTAFLPTQSAEMVKRLRAPSAQNWPAAKAAFLKIGGDDASAMLAKLPDIALQPLVASAFSTVVAKKINVEECPSIDRFVAALAPLPAGSAAELITALIGLVGNKKGSGLPLCPETM